MGSVSFNSPPSPPHRRTCPVCRVALSETGGISFCDVHQLEYDQRQRDGVATKDLNTRWHDSLATWAERPRALEGEPEPERLIFGPVAHPWVAFMRGYSGWLPDWIAVNISTGQVRRFVEINAFDLVDDLEGVRPAPFQEDLEIRWGKPEARRNRESLIDRYRSADGTESLSLMIEDAPFPVYGLSENPFGLRLCSTSRSATPNRISSIGLTFASPDPVNPKVAVSLTSLDRKDRSIRLPPGIIINPGFDRALRLVRGYGKDRIGQIDLVTPQTITRQIVIPGFECDAEILNWPEPIDLFDFSLRSDEVVLGVTTLGLSEPELFQLLIDMAVINDRHDLHQQYQSESDQMRDQRRGKQES